MEVPEHIIAAAKEAEQDFQDNLVGDMIADEDVMVAIRGAMLKNIWENPDVKDVILELHYAGVETEKIGRHDKMADILARAVLDTLADDPHFISSMEKLLLGP